MKFGSLGSNKNNKKEAQKRERNLAERFNGKAMPNSGALDDMPGDVKTDKFLIDDKFTGSKSYSITLETINKLNREAIQVSREPILIMEFRDGVAKLVPSEWALIPEIICNFKVEENYEILGKSKLISVQMLNKKYKDWLKNDKVQGLKLTFFGVSLGVYSDWVLTPLQNLERLGYFK